MSNYRDDITDTAVASSSTWMGLKFLVESSALITSALIVTIGVMHVDGAIASDQVFDSPGHVLTDSATISDSYVDHLSARVLVVDSAAISDRVIDRLRVLHQDSAVASDSVVDRLRVLSVDGATISDQVIGHRTVRELVTDSARISDYAWQPSIDMIEDTAVIGSEAFGKLRARVLLVDSAQISDEVLDAHRAALLMLVDSAHISSEVIDHLHASVLVIDGAVIDDDVPGAALADDSGQAWTASADSWAMSRYAPYTFASLAVIDGVLYGMNNDGVYALDGGDAAIAAKIVTGKVDVGQGILVHPQAAYLEYELDGTAELDVTTTQSGAAGTYTYALEQELANELTNGRFKLGLGLRGRHFAFTLRLNARSGYINDLSVKAAPTSRRI